MGKWSNLERGNALDADSIDKAGIYTDNNGVRWRVKHGDYWTGGGWSDWTAQLMTAPNKYQLAADKVFYTEDSRDAVQSKIDDAAYAWSISPAGPLNIEKLHPTDPKGKSLGMFVAFFVAVWLLGKKGRR